MLKKNHFPMPDAPDVAIEVPPFDIPVILAFNAVLWVMLILLATAVF